MVSVGESHDSKKHLACVERNNKGKKTIIFAILLGFELVT